MLRHPDNRPETMEDLLLRVQRESGRTAEGPLTRLGRFLRTLGRPQVRAFPSLAEVLPHLYPKVRTEIQVARFAQQGAGLLPVSRPLAGNLLVTLTLDLPHQEIDLTDEHLDAWDVDFDRLLQQARANLVRRSGDGLFHAAGQDCFQSTWRDGLDGSRILLPNLLRPLPVKGGPVALLPRPDLLLVAGAGDAEGLVWALGAMLQCLGRDAQATNATPLRLHHARWEPLDLPGGHPAADLLAALDADRRREERDLQAGQASCAA